MSDRVHPSDLIAADVLGCYPSVGPSPASLALGNRGGFSGARLWRVEGMPGPYCLRAWPPEDPTPQRLTWIHDLMQRARDAGLDFVPAIARTSQGTTWVAHAGRLWDLTTWMPGRGDFHDAPSNIRLEAAFQCLAQLHGAWARIHSTAGTCPAITRRLEIAHDWIRMIKSGWQPSFGVQVNDLVRPWAERAWCLISRTIENVPRALASWSERSLPLQPCLCDIWHDHVLFDGTQVSGLIDYGGVKVDHVAVDLARLLGSMVGDNSAQRSAALAAYRRFRSLSSDEQALVNVLAETGTIIAVATWLKWLYRDKKVFEDLTAMTQRLSVLVERMERKQSVIRTP